MNTIELFCGTKSFSNVAKSLGHQTFTIDNDQSFNPCQCVDFLSLPIVDFINKHYDICWASPPCTTFSVASIGRHWSKVGDKYSPKSNEAVIGLKLIDKTIEYIGKVKPTIWFIENPRGMMRKVIDDIFKKYQITDYRRVTISYCQYGDNRMKPTDIWTNDMEWVSKPMCHYGDDCHVAAPRGSKTGTQGLKNKKERGIIPKDIFFEIFNHLEI